MAEQSRTPNLVDEGERKLKGTATNGNVRLLRQSAAKEQYTALHNLEAVDDGGAVALDSIRAVRALDGAQQSVESNITTKRSAGR
jgi:hypothetical protein